MTSVLATQVINPLEEFDQYFSQPCVDRSVCTDLIAWWGVSQFFILCLPFLILLQHQVLEYPVMHLIARDYAAIPGSSCLVEQAFSLSARKDSAHRGNMEKKKFGGLQRLRGAYMDGRLEVHKAVWVALDADFDHLSEDDY